MISMTYLSFQVFFDKDLRFQTYGCNFQHNCIQNITCNNKLTTEYIYHAQNLFFLIKDTLHSTF